MANNVTKERPGPKRRRESRWSLFHRVNSQNPLRRPTWRWEWARAYVEKNCTGSLPTRSQDPYLAVAVRFHQAAVNGRYPHGSSKLGQAHQSIKAAQSIYAADDLRRAELEARILAGQSDSEIARILHIESQVIELYAALLFDVRDRLHASGWIAARVIGWPLDPERFTAAHVRWAWRSVGYKFGLELLNVVIAAVRAPDDLTNGLSHCDLQTGTGRLIARTRLALVAWLHPWSKKLTRELVRTSQLIREADDLERAFTPERMFDQLVTQALTRRSTILATASQAGVEPSAPTQEAASCEGSQAQTDKGDREVA